MPFLLDSNLWAKIDENNPTNPGQVVLQTPGAAPQPAGTADNQRKSTASPEGLLSFTVVPGVNAPEFISPPNPVIATHQDTDFLFRLWVLPPILQLNNPQLNSNIPFRVWNTNTIPEEITAVLVNGSNVLSFDLNISDTIGDFQFREVNLQIDAGEPSIEADVQFITENLIGDLRIIAAVSDTFNLIPDVPISEKWEFRTDVLTNHLGVEQRISLRRYPRISQEFTFEIIDLRQRKEQYNVLRKNIAVQSLVPLYQYSANLTQNTPVGGFKVFLDNARSNFRQGQFAIIVNPTTENLLITRISSVDPDGLTIDSAATEELDDHWVAAPAINALVNDGSGLNMTNVTGTLRVSAESFEEPDLLRPNATRIVSSFDGLPFVDRRPVITAEENFNYERSVLDNSVGVRKLNSSWLHPKVSGNRKFTIQRESDPEEMDYWRSLFDTIRGGQKSFLLSTYFPDLTLAEGNAELQGKSSLLINEDYYSDLYNQYETWRRIQIEYPDRLLAPPTQHVVSSITNNPDGTARINFNPPIPTGANYDSIKFISFLMRWKASDTVAFRHYANYSEISFGVFSSDE